MSGIGTVIGGYFTGESFVINPEFMNTRFIFPLRCNFRR